MELFPCRNKKHTQSVHHFAAQQSDLRNSCVSAVRHLHLCMHGIGRGCTEGHILVNIWVCWFSVCGKRKGEAQKESQKKKSLPGIFLSDFFLSVKKLVFLLFVFDTSRVRFCTCLLHLFSQAKTCLFFPLCLNHIWNRPLSQVTSSLFLFYFWTMTDYPNPSAAMIKNMKIIFTFLLNCLWYRICCQIIYRVLASGNAKWYVIAAEERTI